jgi:hypothetical protein
MSSVLIESDDGELASASAVLRVRATNIDYNQPALVAPSVDPSGGGVLYVEDGALKYRGAEGTVTTIAPA